MKGEAMSIILKGIDLPKDGKTLIVGIYGNGLVSMEYTKPLVLAIEINAEAIQIPKDHGRLIDASELIKSYMKGTKTDIDDFYDTINIIDNAPTILEEEP